MSSIITLFIITNNRFQHNQTIERVSYVYGIVCRNLGGDCGHSVSGSTIEEAKQAMWKHAQEDHADMVATLSDDQKQGMEMKLINFLSAQS